MNIRRFISETLKIYLAENLQEAGKRSPEEETITFVVKKWTQWYKEEAGISACDINTGECMDFAESVYEELLKDYNIKTEILSDAFFYDPYDDGNDLWDVSEFGGKPTYDYLKHGLPSHYWIYYNGKHYDSEKPLGVKNFFQLPTIENFKRKYNL
jgi:hypothetical protein